MLPNGTGHNVRNWLRGHLADSTGWLCYSQSTEFLGKTFLLFSSPLWGEFEFYALLRTKPVSLLALWVFVLMCWFCKWTLDPPMFPGFFTMWSMWSWRSFQDQLYSSLSSYRQPSRSQVRYCTQGVSEYPVLYPIMASCAAPRAHSFIPSSW